MTNSVLSPAAQEIINQFDELPLGGKRITCPYFNNKKTGARAALRVMVGKGSPEEIVEEVELLAQRNRVDLSALSEEEIKQFMVEKNLGADCSGFAFYVLDAEFNGQVKKHITPLTKNIVRKLIAKIRTVENVNVKTLHHEKNSTTVPLSDVKAGDIITMLGTGDSHDLDHVLLISQVRYKKKKPVVIDYVHSLQWKKDGKYNHGIKKGMIHITDIKKPLHDQQWEEAGHTTQPDNETLWRAKTADVLSLRRMEVK